MKTWSASPKTTPAASIQVILGCSVGKGNLLFHMTGKQAFSIYNRTTGRSVRLVLRPRPEGMTREASFAYLQSHTPQELFDVKETRILLPEPARLFESYLCDGCGEQTASHWIHLQEGRRLCPDCYRAYNRFAL